MLKPTLLADTEKSQAWKEDLLSGEQAAVIRDALREVVASPKGTAKARGMPISQSLAKPVQQNSSKPVTKKVPKTAGLSAIQLTNRTS